MKKIITGFAAALTLALSLASCSMPLGLEQEASLSLDGSDARGLGTQKVRLTKVSSYVHTKYGIGQMQRTLEINVANVSPTKEVVVVHEGLDGTWVDFPATFDSILPDGTELWTAYIQDIYPTLGTKFAIRYTTPQGTWWDNNGGQDYDIPKNVGTWLAPGINVRLESGFAYSTMFGVIDVRNIAPNKTVEVVWTSDAWQTTKVSPAVYVGPRYFYGYSTTESPNAFGIEKWSFAIDLQGATTIEYAISYNVAGQNFWDNNHGRNYKVSR